MGVPSKSLTVFIYVAINKREKTLGKHRVEPLFLLILDLFLQMG